MCLYAITQSAIFVSQQLKLNPLDFADGDLVLGPVIKVWWSGATHEQPSAGHARAGLHSPGKPSHRSRAKCDTRPASETPRSALACGSLPRHCTGSALGRITRCQPCSRSETAAACPQY